MTTGATGQLGLALPVQGELSGSWGNTVNNGITEYTNIAIAATLTLTNDGAVTLANTTGDASASNIVSTLTGAGTVTAQFAIVKVTGTLTTPKIITAPSYSKTYVVVNAATGSTVSFIRAGQTPAISIAVGESAYLYYNGTDYVKLSSTVVTPQAYPGAGIANSTGSAWGTSYTTSGSGTVVALATSPSFTTPILGTPQSGNFSTGTFTWPTFNQNTSGSAATFTSTSQDSQFNSVGVGTAASGTAGEIRATNNVTAYYSSDIKFKENVRDIPDALATVNAIGGKLFDWKDDYIESKGGADGYFVQKADFGVVAQDVQKVFPIAVRTREDGSLAVDYEKLGALAFAALVELTKRVEALEAK